MGDQEFDHDGTFGSCTWAEFKEHAAEFFRMAKEATFEQRENGCKALSILYLSLNEGTTELELHQARYLLDMANRTTIEFQGVPNPF